MTESVLILLLIVGLITVLIVGETATVLATGNFAYG